MGISMKNFEMPKKLVLEESSYTPTYGKFVAEPFERGYGVTIGNSLRRVLISSIEGTAVTSIKIAGVHHEFSAIAGVVEDVPEIILNVKRLILKSHGGDVIEANVAIHVAAVSGVDKHDIGFLVK